jgi:hypothetical protein
LPVCNGQTRISKQTLQYEPKGKRIIGSPKKRWRDQLHLDGQGTGTVPDASEVIMMMMIIIIIMKGEAHGLI